MNNSPSVIAICGKGGVGKTSISAMIVKLLSAASRHKVLAVDADPCVGLATALGVTVRKTVDDIRNDLINRIEEGKRVNKTDMISALDYEMFSALEEGQNLAFLAIGRPEKEGCYCQVNHILKDIIGSISGNFDTVIIDGEAGVEQVNRRVMEKVSHLILVSDASAKAIHVAETIKKVSVNTISYEKSGLILNRLRNQKEREALTIPPGLNCLGWIPEDNTIRSTDIAGKSILDIDACPALSALKQCLINIEILNPA